LESAFSQTFQNFEVILVDDGSTDNSVKIIAEIISDNLNYKLIIRNREPKGASTCRNLGIHNSRGDYIIFLDADDILAPACLSQRTEIFQKRKDLDFCVFLTKYFRTKPGDMNRILNTQIKGDDISLFLSLNYPWQTTSVIWKKVSLEKLNGFDEEYARLQDPEIHLRALFEGFKYEKFYDCPIDCYHRVGEGTKMIKLKDQLINSYAYFIRSFQNIICTKGTWEYLEDLRYAVNKIISDLSRITIDLKAVYFFLIELKSIDMIDNIDLLKYMLKFCVISEVRLVLYKMKSFMKKNLPSLALRYRQLADNL
jgi:glycosyltransferase involved in cell wall biosynthesis